MLSLLESGSRTRAGKQATGIKQATALVVRAEAGHSGYAAHPGNALHHTYRPPTPRPAGIRHRRPPTVADMARQCKRKAHLLYREPHRAA